MRRVFVVAREAPGLVAGAWRGAPTSMRRILGGRRSGRIATAATLVALALAAPPDQAAWLTAAHLVASTMGWAARRSTTGLSLRQHQRLLLWLVAPALAAAALARMVGVPSLAASATALLVAHGALGWHLGRPRALGPSATDPRVRA